MKQFLIAIDIQKDFVDGALGTEEAAAMIPAAAARIRECRNAGYTLIATLDTHDQNYSGTAEGKKLPVPHCIRGTEGWKLHPGVSGELEGCLTVEKPTFGSIRLPEVIRDVAGEEDFTIELIGLCTDICVVSNALLLKAHFPEIQISVRADCCAGVTPEKHKAALETMKSCQIDVI